jgi:hypothetical protein
MSKPHLIGGREAVVPACAPDVAPTVRHSIAQGAALGTVAIKIVVSPNGAQLARARNVFRPVGADDMIWTGRTQGCRIWPRWGRSARRRGYLLTEMLVVIGVSSALAAVAVGLLSTLIRVERAGRRHFEETDGLLRLSTQFRRDVAAAEETSVPAENTGRPSEIHLRLGADHTVTYRAEPGVLLRLEEWGQTEAAREKFRLPATVEARFSIEDSRSGRMVMLSLNAQRPADESQKSGQAVDVEKKRRRLVARDGVGRRGWTAAALVARDLRHAPSFTNAKPTNVEPAP